MFLKQFHFEVYKLQVTTSTYYMELTLKLIDTQVS